MSARTFSYLDIGEIVDADTDETVLIMPVPDDEFGDFLEKTLNGYAAAEDAELTTLRSQLATLTEERDRLRETNRALNRRANGADAYWQRRFQKADNLRQMWEESYSQTFTRMMGAHSELSQIFDAILMKRGIPRPAYHSVMDCNVEGGRVWSHGSDTAKGAAPRPEYWDHTPVFANVFNSDGVKTREGPIKSERVLDAVLTALNATLEQLAEYQQAYRDAQCAISAEIRKAREAAP